VLLFLLRGDSLADKFRPNKNRTHTVLSTLRIRNLALVAELTLELPGGLIAVTGETGAGKSILIGALNLALGQRADRTWIRSGADGCTVEAVFDVGALGAGFAAFLEERGIDAASDGQLVVKRTFTMAGANRQFVNGTPTTLAVLAEVGDWLVDIHGPHEHQSLLAPAHQLAILDAYGDLGAAVEAVRGWVGRRTELAREKTTLVVDEQAYAQQLDLLRFQVQEIEAAHLGPGEEAELVAEHRRASNAARLLELSQGALNMLAEDEVSVLGQTGSVSRTLHELARLDPAAAALHTVLEQAVGTLRDLQADLRRYTDRVEVDPGRLQGLEERLALIQSLERKYGNTVPDVIAFGAEARRKLEQLESRDAELSRINAALAEADREAWRVATELSARRRELMPRLARAVSRHLADLGFRQSQFVIDHTALPACAEDGTGAGSSGMRLGATGMDRVEYQFAPNPGEPLRPLREIASSGELARVMLALKTVLAAQDKIPVLVFDEVDANVGGETARVVGEKLRDIARHRQVLCITHLAPVAAAAAAHFVVTKATAGGRTVSSIQRLDRAGQVTELARMMGGQTDAARRHAAALLGD
jgi:DNA repair protein RecN (Recombination protein N)